MRIGARTDDQQDHQQQRLEIEKRRLEWGLIFAFPILSSPFLVLPLRTAGRCL